MLTPEEFFESVTMVYNCPWCGEQKVSKKMPREETLYTGLVHCFKCKELYIRIYRNRDVKNAVHEISNWTTNKVREWLVGNKKIY